LIGSGWYGFPPVRRGSYIPTIFALRFSVSMYCSTTMHGLGIYDYFGVSGATAIYGKRTSTSTAFKRFGLIWFWFWIWIYSSRICFSMIPFHFYISALVGIRRYSLLALGATEYLGEVMTLTKMTRGELLAGQSRAFLRKAACSVLRCITAVLESRAKSRRLRLVQTAKAMDHFSDLGFI